LYTTVYPAAQPYLRALYRSILAQTDRRFALWIASDGLSRDDVAASFGETPDVRWIDALLGETPTGLPGRAVPQMVGEADAVAFVDSDDERLPCRIARARAALESNDLVSCAMTIMHEDGEDTGLVFPPEIDDPRASLARVNVLGLGNSAWRSAMLGHCL